MKLRLRFIALILALLMCLTGCGFVDSVMRFLGFTEPLRIENFSRENNSATIEELMAKYNLTQEYVEETLALLDEMLAASKIDNNIEAFDVIYLDFEERFYHIAQQNTVSMIIFYYNTNDKTASERYSKSNDWLYDVQDKYTTTCRKMYEESPFKDELFADWSEEEIEDLLDYDPATVKLKKEIEQLQLEYNQLVGGSFYNGSVEIYVQVVQKNNELAQLYGYDNYYDYATENVYGRDYSIENLKMFREYIVEYVAPNYNNLNTVQQDLYKLNLNDMKIANSLMVYDFDETEQNYLVDYLNSLPGTMGDSMCSIFTDKNCIFANGTSSLNGAFCTYLYEDETPFAFFGYQNQSSTTLAHEIGHYYAYSVNPDLNSMDLLETHSQGNEFLFLSYLSENFSDELYNVLLKELLMDMYFALIVPTIIDEFEYIVYNLESVEGYTSDDFDAIMESVCERYGGAPWISGTLTDPYYYWRAVCIDNPVYYISYAVSAIAAIEIGVLAEKDREAAMEAYQALVEDATVEDKFLGALTKAGLKSPFDKSTFIEISEIMSR